MQAERSLNQVKIIYLATTIFLVALAFYTYDQIKNFGTSAEWVTRSTKVSLELEKLIGNIKDAETGHRGYLLTHDSTFLQPFNNAVIEYPQHQQNIKQLISNNILQKYNLLKIQRLTDKKIKYMRELLNNDKTRKITNAEFTSGKAIMDSLRKYVNTVNVIENSLLKTRQQKYYQISYLTPIFIIVLFIGALLILFASYVRLNKAMLQSSRLKKELRSIVIEARAAICMLRGPEHNIQLANNSFLTLCKNINIINKPLKQALPELQQYGIFEIVDTVYKTGKTIEKNEVTLQVYKDNSSPTNKIFNIIYRATYTNTGIIDGVIMNAVDVTDIIISHNKIKASEEKLQVAISGGELGTFDFYTETKQLIWSDKTKQMFGLNPTDEITYQLYEEARNLPQNQAVNSVMQTLDENNLYEIEYLVKGINDNVLRWLRSKGKATFNEHGEAVRFTGIVQDISKYKFAQQAIEESEERFRNLAEALPQLVWVTDNKGISEFASSRWEEYSGIKPGGVKEWEAIVHPDDLHGVNNAWMESLNTGKIYNYDVRLKSKTGKYRWHTVIGEPIYNDQNQIIKWVGAFMDSDEQKRQLEIIKENEIKLNNIIEASELGTWELNIKTGKINYSNRLLEIVGYLPDAQPNALDLENQIHPDDLDIRDKAAIIASETGMLNYQCRIILPNKSVKWVETKGIIIKDNTNQPEKVIGTLRDITDEINYTQTLKESEQKFRLLADSMPQHIWTGDAKGNLNYFNQSVFDYSGLTLEQINKDGWLQIVHPEEREENIRLWLECVNTGKDFLFEHRFRKHTGEYRWQLSLAIPQKNDAGQVQMWVGTSTDIQNQKDFATELESQINDRTIQLVKSNTELKKANDELQLFAHISSHDLQEPLRKVQMSISRIAEKDFDTISDKGKEHFKRIKDATITMQTLIEDLQTYSRANNKQGAFEITDLNFILDEVIIELKDRIEEKNATIETGDLCEATIIPFEFRQLLHNLIGNALKFSKPEVAPHIKINSISAYGNNLNNENLVPNKKYCYISIVDNGIGFDSQYNEKIFEVFQRLHGKDKYKGTGIGLAIVKKIVENHEGIIIAKGELNKGATFEIYIPTHKIDEV